MSHMNTDTSKESSTPWFVPLARNRFFTGREAYLRTLYKNFHLPSYQTHTRVQVICGAGGIGKTQTALEYAYRFRNDYTTVLWLRTETPEMLLSDLMALTDALDLPEKQVRGQQQILPAVKRWLNMHANWLLILDNVEELDILHELVPTHCANHVLLTTRRQGAAACLSPLNLHTWSNEEGALFLLRRARLLPTSAPLEAAQEELRTQAADICKELGGLPLALDQAGAYLEETRCTLSGYQQRLHERQILLLSRRGPESFAHPDPVTTTILLAVERVEQQWPAAAELLRLLAFVASDAIPEELITRQSAETLGPVLYASATNPFDRDTIYSLFNATSLVELNVQTRLLTIHRLVQAVIRIHMDKESQQQWVRRALLAVNQSFPSTDYSEQVQSEQAPDEQTQNRQVISTVTADQLLPHALLTLHWVDHFLTAEQQLAIAPEISDLSCKVSSYLVTRGHQQKAQALLERCLSLREQTLGSMHLAVAEPLRRLGYLLRLQGLHANAQAVLERALAIYEQASLSTSPALIAILANLSMLSLDRGHYQQAETYMKRVIAIQEQSAEIEDTVPALTDLSTIYQRQGRYEEAKALLLHAIHRHEQVFGPEDPKLLGVLNNLGNLYWKQCQYTEAQTTYLRALHVSHNEQVVDDFVIAGVLLNLGETTRKQEQYEESLSYYLHALSLWEQALGPGHPITAEALHGLALLRIAQGEQKEAEHLLHKTIQIREQSYDEAHSLLAEAIHDLALLYSRQGRDADAEPLFERALQIRKQVLAPTAPAIATSLHQLGLLYARQGRKEKARSHYQQALALREQALGKRHPETQTTRQCLANIDNVPQTAI